MPKKSTRNYEVHFHIGRSGDDFVKIMEKNFLKYVANYYCVTNAG